MSGDANALFENAKCLLNIELLVNLHVLQDHPTLAGNSFTCDNRISRGTNIENKKQLKKTLACQRNCLLLIRQCCCDQSSMTY
ncbi:hypothetical protein M8J77_016301 [Diaphorina citri]|nr:hypothetical protein M8J77_016301 [Diaphorina citri]